MSAIAQEDREGIHALISQYSHAVDEGHFDAWVDLFTEDGFYWVPLERDQTDPHLVTSLLYEDLFLLRLRRRSGFHVVSYFSCCASFSVLLYASFSLVLCFFVSSSLLRTCVCLKVGLDNS